MPDEVDSQGKVDKKVHENYGKVLETLSEIVQGKGSVANNIKAALKGYQTLLVKA